MVIFNVEVAEILSSVITLPEICAIDISFSLASIHYIRIETVVIRIITGCHHIFKHKVRPQMYGSDAEIRMIAIHAG